MRNIRQPAICAKALVFVTAFTVLSACGSVAEDDGGEALATLNGQVTNAKALAVQGGVHVALVWRKAVCDQANAEQCGEAVAQELEVQPEFPVGFQLRVNAPPPEDCLFPFDDANPGARVAWGTLIAYEAIDNLSFGFDEDGRPLDHDPFWGVRGHVIGKLDRTDILYLEGVRPDVDPQPSLGFSLVDLNPFIAGINQRADCRVAATDDAARQACDTIPVKPRLLSIDTSITLPLGEFVLYIADLRLSW